MDGRGLTPPPRPGTPPTQAFGQSPPPMGPNEPSDTVAAGVAKPAPGGRRRTVLLASALVLALIAAAAGWFLAVKWQGRAETAENEYRDLEQALDASTSDVSSLEERQRQLADEKASLEDERTVLEQEKASLQTQQAELATALDTLTQIANSFSSCSEGYSRVIADLAAGNVTASTQATAQAAEAACARGNELVRALQ